MNVLLMQAQALLFTPYRWGGNSPMEGLDCSGLVCELMRSAGEIPFRADMSAQQLYDHFAAGKGEHNRPGLGSLVFFGESVTKITHVAMMVDNYRMIEAGGGGSDTLTKEDAIKKGAMVRIRLVDSRSDKVGMIKPYYRRIGMI